MDMFGHITDSTNEVVLLLQNLYRNVFLALCIEMLVM